MRSSSRRPDPLEIGEEYGVHTAENAEMSNPTPMSAWSVQALKDRMIYIENAPMVTTMGESLCGHGYSRGGGTCWNCCARELAKRWKVRWDDVKHELKTLRQIEAYATSKRKGNSHNLSMMLAVKSGPAGKVKGSTTPCPKRKA